MIIYGRRKIRIKKYDDYHIKCENCNGYEQRYSVYQEYFHLFFIPIFPSSIKTIKTTCLKCNDTFNQEKRNHYLSITRTPIYMYSGIILFFGLIVTIVFANLNAQKEKAVFIDNPKIGDVYLIRQDSSRFTTYYFLKIKNIRSDTIILLHGALQFNSFKSTMYDADYFVKNDSLLVLKNNLKVNLKNGLINMVIRDYELNSKFRTEK